MEPFSFQDVLQLSILEQLTIVAVAHFTATADTTGYYTIDSDGAGASPAKNILCEADCKHYRRTITINNPGTSTETNIQTRIKIDTSSLISALKMHSECNDIRVYSGEVKQKHWVADNTCNTDSTDIWIKVDELEVGDNQLTLCYGDTTLSNQSNGNETFPVYFDDFVRETDNDFGDFSWTGLWNIRRP